MTLCHNVQTATLLINFGFGHVLQYTPFILNFSALHFTHSYPAKEGVPKFYISTHPPFFIHSLMLSDKKVLHLRNRTLTLTNYATNNFNLAPKHPFQHTSSAVLQKTLEASGAGAE